MMISAETKVGNGAEFLFSPISYQLNSLALKRPVLLWMTEKSAHSASVSATKQSRAGRFVVPGGKRSDGKLDSNPKASSKAR